MHNVYHPRSLSLRENVNFSNHRLQPNSCIIQQVWLPLAMLWLFCNGHYNELHIDSDHANICQQLSSGHFFSVHLHQHRLSSFIDISSLSSQQFNTRRVYRDSLKFKAEVVYFHDAVHNVDTQILHQTSHNKLLNLYSTATQMHWYWGFVFGQPPIANICVGDTNMLASPNANFFFNYVNHNTSAKMCITSNANAQCEQVEYRLRWVPDAKSSRWPCTFHFLLVSISFAMGPVFQWNMGSSYP